MELYPKSRAFPKLFTIPISLCQTWCETNDLDIVIYNLLLKREVSVLPGQIPHNKLNILSRIVYSVLHVPSLAMHSPSIKLLPGKGDLLR